MIFPGMEPENRLALLYDSPRLRFQRGKNMRSLVLSAILFCAIPAIAAERLAVVVPPPEEDELQSLLETVSDSCSKKDFRTFINCFTPSRQSVVRGRMEDFFICGDFKLDVLDHFIISHDGELVVFGLKYEWSSHSGRATLFSKVVAKRCGGVLKLDTEQVRKVAFSEQLVPKSEIAARDCPGGVCGIPVKDCPGGVCAPPAGQGWRFPIPENGGEEAFLPRDIGYIPGPSCANGNCGR